MMKLFNQRELDVLEILLHSDEPLTCTDITFARRDITQSTVTPVLRKLLNDGIVEVVGVTHSGKVLSRTYKISDLGVEKFMAHFIEVSRPFVNFFGLPKLVTAILSSRDEEQRSTMLSELKESFKS